MRQSQSVPAVIRQQNTKRMAVLPQGNTRTRPHTRTHTFTCFCKNGFLVLGKDDEMLQNRWLCFQRFRCFYKRGKKKKVLRVLTKRTKGGTKERKIPTNWNSLFFIFFLSRLNANVLQAPFVGQNQWILFPSAWFWLQHRITNAQRHTHTHVPSLMPHTFFLHADTRAEP